RPPPFSTLFPYTTLFRSLLSLLSVAMAQSGRVPKQTPSPPPASPDGGSTAAQTKPSPPLSLLIVNSVNSARAAAWTGVAIRELIDRKSTRLNSSHLVISY